METPSEYFKMPVKGKIVTKNYIDDTITTYDYLDKDTKNGHVIYLCNQWYKEYKTIPQFIADIFVIKEIEYK